jgi:serine/threonine-protein kinase HipA
MFKGRKVSHTLPYHAPTSSETDAELFIENRTRVSISGVQEKFSVRLDKNRIRLIAPSEQGQYILKPIPSVGKKADQMPANEHLTMQIARQVFGIETAENALIFFQGGSPAYLTKRFDLQEDGQKWGQEDFASLAGRTPQTDGAHYKYHGNYLALFDLMRQFVPAYKVEALKLYERIVFNYLFSNGDAHLKNFSLLETPLGDYRLSPAYDLLNSRIHIADQDFALEEGLLPRNKALGTVRQQFMILAQEADIAPAQALHIFEQMRSHQPHVEALIQASYLEDKTKRNYLQMYQGRLNKLMK